MTTGWQDAVQRARRQTVSDVFRRTVARVPDKLALVYKGERLTYRELEERVAATAAALWTAGVGRGDRVAVLAKNNLDGVIAYYATLRVGAIWVPMNYMLTASEVAYILGHVEACALLVAPALRGVAEAALAQLADEGRPLTLKLRWLMDTDAVDEEAAAHGWRALAEMYRDDAFRAAGEGADYPADGDDVAQILYTSGTESRPKGVMLTHESLI
ncbi:MAG: AMP-binding protein, partial [Thermoflavifilum sp.]|nr:AMP-binding protein [Thermoflavifilum sp.]MCL6514705.1 AMP-binding protein [Alicyclobacillus sp.]